MIKKLFFLLIALLWASILHAEPIFVKSEMTQHMEKFTVNSLSIRLIVLKHCFESIASKDANQAIEAANFAKTQGLDIENIGNYHIKKDGPVRKIAWVRYNLDELKDFISEQMKINASAGDTFLVYTIGHGGGSGYIQYIGQRKILMDAIAQAAEENNQRTLWWQLSCHAAAKLPPISSLTEKQQELFTMIASSPADQLSYFCTQGAQMKKVFTALAEDNTDIDPDRNETITAKELADFLNRNVKAGRGELLFAKNPNIPIFGMNVVNLIPVVGKRQVPKHFIPMP
jgi:hypothetical protein